MIQTIHHLEMGAGTLEAGRTFSLDHDLWMEDHRPFKFMKHPFVSGVMALETFMEAASLLCPPPDAPGSASGPIPRHPGGSPGGQPGGPHRLPAPGGEPRRRSGLRPVHFQPAYHRQRTHPGPLDHQLHRPGNPGTAARPLPDWPGFTVKPEELDSAQFDEKGMQLFYRKYSNFGERYQVIQGLDGSSSGVIRGRTVFNQMADFAGLTNARYQYSPYLLEALKHLVNSHLLLRDEEVTAAMIPFAINEMRFFPYLPVRRRDCPGGAPPFPGRRRVLLGYPGHRRCGPYHHDGQRPHHERFLRLRPPWLMPPHLQGPSARRRAGRAVSEAAPPQVLSGLGPGEPVIYTSDLAGAGAKERLVWRLLASLPGRRGRRAVGGRNGEPGGNRPGPAAPDSWMGNRARRFRFLRPPVASTPP